MPAFVGTVPEPLYWMPLTLPATEPDTDTAWAEPLYVRGEFVIDKVGVALLMTNVVEPDFVDTLSVTVMVVPAVADVVEVDVALNV